MRPKTLLKHVSCRCAYFLFGNRLASRKRARVDPTKKMGSFPRPSFSKRESDTVPGMWKIREAQLEDVRAVSEVHVAAWKSTYAGLIPDTYLQTLSVEKRAEMWAGALRQREKDPRCKTLFVCEDAQGQIQGFAAGGLEREPECGYDAELYAIYLRRELQRSGAGRLLTQALARWLHSQGYRRMRVWVLEENPSRAFYENLGGTLLPETKTVEIGGKSCVECAYGWDSLSLLAQGIAFKPASSAR